jgi:methionine sulfoxide reductase heme-binding subunit
MTNTKPPTPYKWPILGVCVAMLAVSYLTVPPYGDIADEIGYMLRVTARISFLFLILAYFARPTRVLLGNIDPLRTGVRQYIRHRRYLGLAMAIAHTVHTGYIAALPLVLGQALAAEILILGGGAFVVMWLMVATSNDSGVALLGKNWRRLHLFGLHYLWLVFVYTFVGRIAEDSWYIVAVLAGVAGLLVRSWVYWSGRFRRAR